MFEGIEALSALERYQTVSEAAVRLRLTQSAVTKRLQNLQAEVKFDLLESAGRRLKLTPAGQVFLEKARPLLSQLQELRQPAATGAETNIWNWSIALADSIASSWGPSALRQAVKDLPGLTLELHAHRSVLALESVRLGRYHLGFCSEGAPVADLIIAPLGEEAMALVYADFQRKNDKNRPLITIESSAASWQSLRVDFESHHRELAQRPRIEVETFTAAVQMARAGFGDALVPRGLLRDLRVPATAARTLPALKRKIALYARKTVFHTPAFAKFQRALAQQMNEHLARP